MDALRQFRAILMPITVTVIIPALLLDQTANIGWGLPAPANALPTVAGLLLILGGLTLIVSTIYLFITRGQGTLAPWDPPQRLVVTGVYRYVRNPMITGVSSMVFGEAVLFGSAPLLVWALFVFGLNLIYIPLIEEPDLRQRFGSDYDSYRQHVPRWLPRLTPWSP